MQEEEDDSLKASSYFLGSFESSAYLPACLMPDYCLLPCLSLPACLPSSFIVHALLACACHASSSASASEWAILTRGGNVELCVKISQMLEERAAAAAGACCLLPVPAIDSLTHWGSVIRPFSLGLLCFSFHSFHPGCGLLSFSRPKLTYLLTYSLPRVPPKLSERGRVSFRCQTLCLGVLTSTGLG